MQYSCKLHSSEHLLLFNVHWSVYRKNILIHIQQDATFQSLFYLETALHISGGTTTNHQECKQLYLQHLVFVTPLLLSAALGEGGGARSRLTCSCIPNVLFCVKIY